MYCQTVGGVDAVSLGVGSNVVLWTWFLFSLVLQEKLRHFFQTNEHVKIGRSDDDDNSKLM